MAHRATRSWGRGVLLGCLFLVMLSPKTGLAKKDLSVKTLQSDSGFFVVLSTRMDLSPELRSLKPALLRAGEAADQPPDIPNFVLPKALRQPQESALSSVLALENPIQTSPNQMPAPRFNFDGVANLFGGWPPDTQGDIGPNHYIQWINLHFAVWQLDKVNLTAELVYGPVPGTTLFQGFGGACENNNDGDPITLYDPLADRWFMSQFALPYYPSSPFYQCVAVSATSDPLGSWHRYEYEIPSGKMNDYPKFGVWSNAYFMSVNQFNSGTSSWAGAGVAALERSAMLAGEPARMVYLDLYSVNRDYGGMLPADFDGPLPPPDNEPGYFLEWDDSSWLGGVDGLRLWEFQVDWEHPDEAVFGLSGNPNTFIPTQNVDPSMCNFSRNCIPQPGTTMKLDAISDRLMYRLQYRNFSGYASLVSNHTVDVDGTDHAGIHWFELRKSALNADWALHQEGIYAPDSSNRWMGSAAMDHVGNLALGFSLSSTAIHPSVGYTGRFAGDPLGSMFQGEAILVAGSGSQTGSSRWGDYSMMGVDPIDDCTFWYTQEYVAQTGSNTWKTRIGAFRFPGCVIGEQGVIQGTVRSSMDSNPIQGAQVQAVAGITQTLATLSDTSGIYSIQAPIGVYTLTASAFGYYPQTLQDVEVFADLVTTRNFTLDPAPFQIISGVVKDAQTGWPLYAQVRPIGVSTSAVWSDPITGYYSISIPAGSTFLLTVEPFMDGYISQSTSISNLNGDMTVNFDLQVDAASCNALGYQPQIAPIFSSDFEADSGGLTTSGLTSWAWGAITNGPGAAHSGQKGWATNLYGDYANNENGLAALPVIDLSLIAGQSPALGWWQWLESEARYDFASIEASKDGGGSWQTVYGPMSGLVDQGWRYHFLTLDPSFAVNNLQIRFRFTSDSTVTYPGWYLDDIEVGEGACLPVQGGLIAGNVLDANTLDGLNGAVIVSDSGGSSISVSTPEDPALDDGFYMMFSPSGTQTFTATYRTDYLFDTATVNIPLYGTVRQDFELQAGWLDYSPDALEVELELGETAERQILLENNGGISANFEWVELRGTHLPFGPIEEPVYANKPFKADIRSAEKLGITPPSEDTLLSAGQVIQSWIPLDVEGSWAAAYDRENQTVWVSSPSQWWGGEDSLIEFSENGTPTGRIIPHSMDHSSGPADLAYNWNTGKLWVMNINTGVANCIFEVDPQLGYTGEKICPGGPAGFSLSQRGLAYDPFSDTWFAGSWNDLMIHRFDGDGTILSSVNLGLPISGLAYQPESQHLFVMTSESTTRVFVLDAANGYEQIGYFQVSEGFDSYSGGGLEFDCSGNLWAVDINENKVVQFESGETASFCNYDIPWIEAQPASGTIESEAVEPITVTFDARLSAIDQPGIYSMLYKLREDTPYSLPNLPVTMTVTSPPGWGKLNGTIQSPGYCDSNLQPLRDALVTITSHQGITWTLASDAEGYYQRWLDAQGSPFTLTVSAPGYAAVQQSAIQVVEALTTTVNFDLDWLQPCVHLQPNAISETVKLGRQITTTLILENVGHADTPFTFHEVEEIDSDYFDLDWISVVPYSGTLTSGAAAIEAVLTMDAGAASITQPGVYSGGLVLETLDPVTPLQHVPVTMTVTALEYGLQLTAPSTELQGIPGETLEYSLQITNTSDGLQDTFHLQILDSSWPAQLSTENVGPLTSGESAPISLAVSIPDSVLPGDFDQLTVLAVSQGDFEKTASLSFTTSALEPSADLELQMGAPQDPYLAGVEITYTITITNRGPTSAPEVIYIDQLSPKFNYLSDSAGCTRDGLLLICKLGWLKADEVRSVMLNGVPIRLGSLLNQGAVISGAIDPDMANNFAAIEGLVEGIFYYFNWLPVQ